MSRTEQTRERTPIAIVGVAGTFAGSRDTGEYWDNILREVDCITDVPATHWAIDDYFDPDPKTPDKTYSKRGGFIPGMEFNPLEFGLPPNILELTDVAQLLSLAVASRALTDAGYGESNPHAERTGVVLGASALSLVGPLAARLQYPVWRRVLQSRRIPEKEIDAIIKTIKKAYVEWREDAFPGYLSNVVAGRIANRLNLGGINCSVDAACASSMASVQFAMHELRSGGCDVMLAGGVDTNNTPMGFVSFSKTPAFTKHDRMRPFDEKSDGMLVGEGVGILVLRRLEDAERDGQRVYAVIRGVGASSDGRFSSIYAPRQAGQELALRRAYEEAGVAPTSVGLLEAHGTGTPSGDPTEVAALQAVFGDTDKATIAIGSVKSQIGHTKVAAGAASLIKAALALHEKVLPPTINVETPHHAIRAPFYVNTKARPWFSAAPRRAGVSSFGFGGTNFHVVLEEHRHEKPDGRRTRPTPFALFLYDTDMPSLAAHCASTAKELRSDDGAARFRELGERSKSQAIPGNTSRIGFLAATKEEAAARLDEAAASLSVGGGGTAKGAKFHFRERAMDVTGSVVALFPGQGSQSVGMGASLVANFKPVHEAFAKLDAVRTAQGLPPVSKSTYPPAAFGKEAQDAQAKELRATNNAQAAIGALNLGLYSLLQRCGFSPDFVAGHSLGELTALHAGGVLAEDDYLSLLVARGEAMAQPPPSGVDAGTLLAVGGDTAMLEDFLADRPGVTIANRNSRSQLVVAGTHEELSGLKAELAALGITATLLPVSGAFHSHRVAHAQAPFAQALGQVAFGTPRVPVFANTTAAPYPAGEDERRRLLGEQLVHPVEFRKEIEALHDAGGRIFVECGPGRVLTGLVGNILGDRPHLAIALNKSRGADDDLSLRDAYVQLRVAGVELGDLDPWQALPAASPKKRGTTVQLTGMSYKSERTRLAFEEALQRAPEKKMTDTAIPETTKTLQEPLAEPFTLSAALSDDPTAQAHVRFLAHMADCTNHSYELAQQLYALATDPACPPAALAAFERAISSFHGLQTGAQAAHTQFLAQRVEAPRRSPAPSELSVLEYTAPRAPTHHEGNGVAPSTNGTHPAIEAAPRPRTATFTTGPSFGAPAATARAPARETPRPPPPPPRPAAPPPPKAPPPAAPTPVAARPAAPPKPASNGAPMGADEIAAILLGVISEKTGYPLDTLDVNMDVDADLGIDSLKRVEIMAALEGRLFKSMSGIDFSSFATKRTVAQIAQYLAELK